MGGTDADANTRQRRDAKATGREGVMMRQMRRLRKDWRIVVDQP